MALSQGAYPKLQKPLASGGETRMRITSMGSGDAFCHEAGDTGGIEEGGVIYMMVVVSVDTQAQELLGDNIEGVAPTGL